VKEQRQACNSRSTQYDQSQFFLFTEHYEEQGVVDRLTITF